MGCVMKAERRHCSKGSDQAWFLDFCSMCMSLSRFAWMEKLGKRYGEKKRQDQSGSKFIRGFFMDFFTTSTVTLRFLMALWRKLDPESVYFVAVEGRERKKHCDCSIDNWDQLRLVQVQKLSARTKNKRWALPCGKWSKKVAKEPDSWEIETQRQQSQASNCSRFSFHSFASDAHLLAVALLMCRMWPGDALHKCYQRVVTRTHAMQVRWGGAGPGDFFQAFPGWIYKCCHHQRCDHAVGIHCTAISKRSQSFVCCCRKVPKESMHEVSSESILSDTLPKYHFSKWSSLAPDRNLNVCLVDGCI